MHGFEAATWHVDRQTTARLSYEMYLLTRTSQFCRSTGDAQLKQLGS